MNAAQRKELKSACEKVERFARLIGRDCQVLFLDNEVQVAPLSWGGAVNEPTLYDALVQAESDSR